MTPPNETQIHNPDVVPTVKKRIALIVDDGELIRRTASYLLLRLNFDIATASDGYRGVQLALQLVPDIILLDILMPQLDGLQVLQVLKSQEKTKSIPVIVITGHSDEEKFRTALSLGAACVLRKPLKENVLFGKLREIIGPELDGLSGFSEHEKAGWVAGDDMDEEDEKMLLFLRKQFVQLYTPRVKTMIELAGSKQLKDLQHIVHDIKGSAGTVGYSDVTEKAAEIEALLKKGTIEWEEVSTRISAFATRMAEVRKEVDRLPE